jgi:hypothetical protein
LRGVRALKPCVFRERRPEREREREKREGESGREREREREGEGEGMGMTDERMNEHTNKQLQANNHYWW